MGKYRIIKEPRLNGFSYIPQWKDWWWPFWSKFGAPSWPVEFMDEDGAVDYIERNIEFDKKECSVIREW